MEINLHMALHRYRLAFEKGCVHSAFRYAGLCRKIDDGNDRDAESLRRYNYGYRVRCPLATYALALIYNYGELGEERNVQKAISFYDNAIQYHNLRNDRNEVGRKAEERLLALLVTCNIVGESAASRKVSKKKQDELLKDARKQVELIVAATKKPGVHSGLQSAVKALESLLGKDNVKAVNKHLNSPLLSPAL